MSRGFVIPRRCRTSSPALPVSMVQLTLFLPRSWDTFSSPSWVTQSTQEPLPLPQERTQILVKTQYHQKAQIPRGSVAGSWEHTGPVLNEMCLGAGALGWDLPRTPGTLH